MKLSSIEIVFVHCYVEAARCGTNYHLIGQLCLHKVFLHHQCCLYYQGCLTSPFWRLCDVGVRFIAQ